MSNEDGLKKKEGCGKKLAIGCFTVSLLLAAGGFFAYRGAKSLIDKLTAEYSETKPIVLPSVRMPEAEKVALFQRVDAFSKAIRTGGAVPDLTLSARDINVLIQKTPAWANKIYVGIEGDRLTGEASIPLEEFGSLFKGRWLNGSAGFSVNMIAGRLVVFIDTLSVRGKPVPDSFMRAIRSKNVAEQVSAEPKVAEVLQKLDSLSVRDGRLVLKAK